MVLEEGSDSCFICTHILIYFAHKHTRACSSRHVVLKEKDTCLMCPCVVLSQVSRGFLRLSKSMFMSRNVYLKQS